jgi:PII-like signaling protein
MGGPANHRWRSPAMTSFERPSQLTIYVCDNAVHHHKPLCDVIVHRAQEAGLAGATVLRGIEGFGRAGDIHTTRILDVSDHLPISIVIVDDDAKLRDFVHHNDDVLHGRLVTLDQLEIYPAATQA